MKQNKYIYYSLISTFIVLYLCIAFVSTLHAITFFQLSNTLTLAIILGAAYEVAQSSVLFSILASENRNKLLSWSMMILLTSLQITANVYASFKFMDQSGNNDWTYWQRSILFALQADSPEMYKVTISWISGALLPIVALGMTALIAENIKFANQLKQSEKDTNVENSTEKEINTEEELITNEVVETINNKIDKTEEIQSSRDIDLPVQTSDKSNIKQQLNDEDNEDEIEELSNLVNNEELLINNQKKDELKSQIVENKIEDEPVNEHVNEPVNEPIIEDEPILEQNDEKDVNPIVEVKKEEPLIDYFDNWIYKHNTDNNQPVIIEPVVQKEDKKDVLPSNKIKGWHLLNEYVDKDYNVFNKGVFIGKDLSKTPTKKE